MRSSKSRSRNKNRNRSVGNVVNRVFDSSGPEGKVRGTPQQVIEKYNQLARDAQLAGDRVATENFQQHAEHYTRLLAAAMKEQDARREQQEQQNRERQQQQNQQRQQKGQAAAEGTGDQPDVVEAAPETDSGLVETPEAQSTPEEAAPEAPAKPKRSRSRARAKAPAEKSDAAVEDKPAAE